MPKALDPAVGEVLRKYGYGKEAVWDCHGTWVVYHRVLEGLAAKAGIEFDMPMPLETNGAAKTVAICVRGHTANPLDGEVKSEWSIGEASPGNNKNSYPYAMAEKRAKDRVILKLIGLHGMVYSEEEADAFKEPQNGNGRKSSAQAKRDGDWETMQNDLRDCHSAVTVQKLWDDYKRNIYSKWNQDWRREADELFAHVMAQFSNGAALKETLQDSIEESAPQTRAEFIQGCHDRIADFTDATALLTWWNGDKAARTRFSLSKDETTALRARVMERRDEINQAPHGRDVAGRPLAVTEAG